ncbi:MAG: HAD family phosphatase [Anaerolineae bacterium]|jgi:putative hydrolase of the HAD superfamily
MTDIRAIIFDFGRVISAQKPPSLFRRYEQELELPPGQLNRIMYGSPAWEETLLGRRSLDDYWREIGPQLGLHTAGDIQGFRQRYFSDEAPNPGVRQLLDQLHGRYKLAVLSNAPRGLSKWLADWGILSLFDVVVCSGEEGVAKPDPTIYRLALDRLGVEPGEAVFVDDSRGHVAAARELGIHAIHFTTAAALADALSDLQIL